MGKGSIRRPTDQARYNANWERIFNKKVNDDAQAVLDFGDNDCGSVDVMTSPEVTQ